MVSKNSQIIRVAELYYLQNKTQQEIAKEIGVSRPTVSRLLEEARAQKIVEIKMNIREEVHVQLSGNLRKKLGIPEVIVVANNASSPEMSLVQTAHVAAEHLKSILQKDSVLGVSWGRILKETGNALPSMELPGLKIVQIVGGIGGANSGFDGSDVPYIFASRLSASFQPVLAPTILPDRETADTLRSVPTIRDALQAAMDADIYLTGIGALNPDTTGSLQRAGYIDDAEKALLMEQGAVGHLIGRIIRRDGSELDTFNNRTVAIPLDQLRRGHTIGITTSAEKAEAVLAAVQGNYLKTLILDEACAREILHLLDKPSAL